MASWTDFLKDNTAFAKAHNEYEYDEKGLLKGYSATSKDFRYIVKTANFANQAYRLKKVIDSENLSQPINNPRYKTKMFSGSGSNTLLVKDLHENLMTAINFNNFDFNIQPSDRTKVLRAGGMPTVSDTKQIQGLFNELPLTKLDVKNQKRGIRETKKTIRKMKLSGVAFGEQIIRKYMPSYFGPVKALNKEGVMTDYSYVSCNAAAKENATKEVHNENGEVIRVINYPVFIRESYKCDKFFKIQKPKPQLPMISSGSNLF
jgi:hypothetical protein